MHSKHSTIYFTKPFKEKFINQVVVGIVGGKMGIRFPKNRIAVFDREGGKLRQVFFITQSAGIVVAGNVKLLIKEPNIDIRIEDGIKRVNITVDSVGIKVHPLPELLNAEENTITIYDSEGHEVGKYEKADVYAFSERVGIAVLTNDTALALSLGNSWFYEVHGPLRFNKTTYYQLKSIISTTLSAKDIIVY